MGSVQYQSKIDIELTKEKIESILRKTQRQNVVFSDKKYLDPLFLSSKIIGREKHAEQLLRYFESRKQGLIVPVISVYGRSGSGKSTVVRFVCSNLDSSISHVFVNLRRAKTIFGCANLILSELGLPGLKNAHGLNSAIDIIEKRIVDMLEKEKKKFFVLVLDEYDAIFSDSRGNPSDFIYKFLTLEENLRERGFWLCLVTISNNALADNELDDRVKSRMGSSEIFFEPYGEGDVLNILQDRSRLAFAKTPNIDVLQYCAKLSSDDHGDARRALDLLRTAGENCKGKITKEDIDNASRQLQYDRVNTILANASYHLKVVIGALCSLHVLVDSRMHATSAIYKRYTRMLQKETKPLSYRRIVDLLIELKNSGLVDSQTVSRGRHGYGTQYRLRFAPETIGPLVSNEWWNNVLESKKDHERRIEQYNAPSPFPRNPFAKSTKRINAMMEKFENTKWTEDMGL